MPAIHVDAARCGSLASTGVVGAPISCWSVELTQTPLTTRALVLCMWPYGSTATCASSGPCAPRGRPSRRAHQRAACVACAPSTSRATTSAAPASRRCLLRSGRTPMVGWRLSPARRRQRRVAVWRVKRVSALMRSFALGMRSPCGSAQRVRFATRCRRLPNWPTPQKPRARAVGAVGAPARLRRWCRHRSRCGCSPTCERAKSDAACPRHALAHHALARRALARRALIHRRTRTPPPTTTTPMMPTMPMSWTMTQAARRAVGTPRVASRMRAPR